MAERRLQMLATLERSLVRLLYNTAALAMGSWRQLLVDRAASLQRVRHAMAFIAIRTLSRGWVGWCAAIHQHVRTDGPLKTRRVREVHRVRERATRRQLTRGMAVWAATLCLRRRIDDALTHCVLRQRKSLFDLWRTLSFRCLAARLQQQLDRCEAVRAERTLELEAMEAKLRPGAEASRRAQDLEASEAKLRHEMEAGRRANELAAMEAKLRQEADTGRHAQELAVLEANLRQERASNNCKLD
eukprot:6631126-Prymnesium_polylepis.1